MAGTVNENNAANLSAPRTQFYGRRKARPLRPARAQALETGLPAYELAAEGIIDPQTMFAPAITCYWLDIGFGNGEILADWVKTNPTTGYIGVEPFINGVSAFLKKLHSPETEANEQFTNLKLRMDIAEPVLQRLMPQTLDVVSLLNPDPWPKARHAKRRFIRPENVQAIARVLKPNGLFFTCTDSPELAERMALESVSSGLFVFDATQKASWETPPAFWAPTRYAQKDMAQSGRMFFLSFSKKPL